MPTTSSPPLPVRRSRRRRVWLVGLGVLLVLYFGAVVPGSPWHVSVLFPPAATDNGRGVRQLQAALGDPDPAVRKDAALALGRLASAATAALPRLAEVLRNDPDPAVRSAAAEAIRKMSPASRAVVGDLAAALRDPEPFVRMNACIALLSLKEEARPAIPDLIAGAGDEENDTNLDQFSMTIRQSMLRALGVAAAGTGDAVPTLSALLEGPAADASRAIAAHGLGLAGPHAREAAPLLRALLRDHDPDVRAAAEEALVAIGVDRNGPVRFGEFDNLELPESERKRLWEIEHRLNVLNAYGFESAGFGALARRCLRVVALSRTRFRGVGAGRAHPCPRVRVPGRRTVAAIERPADFDERPGLRQSNGGVAPDVRRKAEGETRRGHSPAEG